MNITRRSITTSALVLGAIGALGPLALGAAHADDRSQSVADAQRALSELEAKDSRAAFYAKRARGILVFPNVLKAGFVFGGETGNGVLLVRGAPAGYYNLSGGSWGLQIGGQDFAYALFFMTRTSLDYLQKSAGFDVGTGPSIVVVNASAGAEANVTTVTHDVYAFPFNGKGLMADLTLQGTKITPIHPH